MQIFDKLRLLLKAELKITLFFEKIRIKKNTNFCYVIFIYVCVTVLSKQCRVVAFHNKNVLLRIELSEVGQEMKYSKLK